MGTDNDLEMLFEITNRIDNEDIPGLRKEIAAGIAARELLSTRIGDNHDLIERMIGTIEGLAVTIVDFSRRLQKLESAAGSRPPVDIG